MMQELSPTLQALVEEAELLRLAFVDRQGYPRVVPVWFVLLDGAYYIGIGTTSAKWKAMQRNPHVGWVIDGGTRGHYKGASVRGLAEEVREATWRARVYDALGKKYFGAADDAEFINIFGQVDDPESVYVRLIPDAALTWEH
jgi:nitroimidazol reductase NimA-like FMN-containing flavoprotein (pyridoxamine 5'-phosphate oxidase superfamily)